MTKRNNDITLELVQSVQTANHSIPLVPDKKTLVRLYFCKSFNFGNFKLSELQLCIGEEQVPAINSGEYKNNGYDTSVDFRLDLSNSLNFFFDALPVQTGTDVKAKLSPPGTDLAIHVKDIHISQTIEPFHLNVIAYKYETNYIPDDCFAKSDPRHTLKASKQPWQKRVSPPHSIYPESYNIDPIRGFFQRISPAHQVDGNDVIMQAPLSLTNPFPEYVEPVWNNEGKLEDNDEWNSQNHIQRYLANTLHAHLLALKCSDILANNNEYEANSYYYGMVDGDAGFLRGAASWVPPYKQQRPDAVSFGLAEPEGSYAAHEIAHVMGLAHPGYPTEDSVKGDRVRNQQFSFQTNEYDTGNATDNRDKLGLGDNGQIAANGSDLIGLDFGQFPHQMRTIDPSYHYDLMTYHDQLWIAQSTYMHLLEHLAVPPTFTESPLKDALTIIAAYDYTDDTRPGRVDVLYCLPGIDQTSEGDRNNSQAAFLATRKDQSNVFTVTQVKHDARLEAHKTRHGIFRIVIAKSELPENGSIVLNLFDKNSSKTKLATGSFNLPVENEVGALVGKYFGFGTKHGYELEFSFQDNRSATGHLIVECREKDVHHDSEEQQHFWRTVLCESFADKEICAGKSMNNVFSPVFIDRRIFGEVDELQIRCRLLSGAEFIRSSDGTWHGENNQLIFELP